MTTRTPELDPETLARSADNPSAVQDRTTLQIYTDACGATYGDPDVGAAVEVLLRLTDQEAFLGKVSFAQESAGPEERDSVRVDLEAIVRSCDEAIAGRPRDGSVPRVVISADALRTIASFAKAITREASRVLSMGPSGAHRIHNADEFGLAHLAMRGPVVEGVAASDAWGEVVYPFYGHPIDLGRSAEATTSRHTSRHVIPEEARGDPVDDVLALEHRTVLESIAVNTSNQLASAIQSGLSVLGGGTASLSADERATLERYATRARSTLGVLGEDEDGSTETWRGVRAGRALLRSVDVVTGHALPRWTHERSMAVQTWWEQVSRGSDVHFDQARQVAARPIGRALAAAHDGQELPDDDREIIEDVLRSAEVVQSRQIWAVNLRSLLVAIPLRTEAEREARTFRFLRFSPVSSDPMSFSSETCAMCGRGIGRHYALWGENRCHPIDHDIPGSSMREAEALARRASAISATSRVVLWRISAIDREVRDGSLAKSIDRALASIDTSGHATPPSLKAVREWLGDRGRHRGNDDAIVVALQALLDAIALRFGSAP